MLSYVGPDMSGMSLRGTPNRIRMMYSISQFIDSEADEMKKCKNYPYNGFLNYQECDEDFVINKFRKIYNDTILPFWVVDDLEKVKNQVSFIFDSSTSLKPSISNILIDQFC